MLEKPEDWTWEEWEAYLINLGRRRNRARMRAEWHVQGYRRGGSIHRHVVAGYPSGPIPSGSVFLLGADGAYLLGADGAYLLGAA